MNKLQENQISNEIEQKIEKIYAALLPPVHFRSNIEFYEEEKEMRRDCRSYFYSDYQIENIQYQLELDKQRNEKEKSLRKDNNDVVVYYFNIKNLLPKSQLLEFTAYVKSQFGCKIQKTKASNTKMELHLERESKKDQKELESKKDQKEVDSKKSKKEQIYVFLGQVQGKFKIRLSNYELLEESN